MQAQSNTSPITAEQAFQVACGWDVVDGKHIVTQNYLSLAEVLQIPVFEMLFPHANDTNNRGGVRGILKKYNQENNAKFFHSWIQKKERHALQVDVCTLFDTHNSSMINSLNKVSQEFSTLHSTCAIATDSKLQSRSQCTNQLLWTNNFSSRDLCRSRVICGLYKRLLSKNSAMFKEKMIDELDIAPNLAKKIIRYAKSQCGSIAREYVAITNVLTHLKPKFLLLASDVHRAGRISVAAAKNLGIKTVVIQHGFPVWKYAFVPVKADRICVWGSFEKDWFIQNGTGPEKITVVGNVLCDTQPKISMLKETPRKIVFLPNPIDPKYNKTAILSLLRVIDTTGCRGIIKLHPSEEKRVWYEQLVSNSSLVSVIQKPISSDIISQGDVVLVSNSTSGIEAVLLGAHIANIVIPGMPNPIPYEKYGVGCTGLLEDTEKVILKTFEIDGKNYNKKRDQFLELLLHRLDGKAAKRVTAEIGQTTN